MSHPYQAKSMRSRMLGGELYCAADAELTEMRDRAQMLLHNFNNMLPTEFQQQRALIKDLFGSIGNDFEIRPNFRCDYGSNIHVGDGFYANFDCTILDCNEVRIGDRCFLAPKVQIYTAGHPIDAKARGQGWEYASPIEIGDDVWLGGGVIVCPGVTIGSGTIVGAGSVVTKDLPSRVVAVGNPCRVIRELAPGPS